MAFDKDKFLKMLQEAAKNAIDPECPKFFDDERLEDAFLVPNHNDEDRSVSIPAIWSDYSYKEQTNGVRVLTNSTAIVNSCVFSKYIDSEALVWDSYKNILLLYIPDPEMPKMAFKGENWLFAKRLKPEFANISLEDIYLELINNNDY